jgi:hypothetical protein
MGAEVFILLFTFVFMLVLHKLTNMASDAPAQPKPISTKQVNLSKWGMYGTHARAFKLVTNPATFCDQLVEFFQTHHIGERRDRNAPPAAQTSWWFVSRRDDENYAVFATIIYPEYFPLAEQRTMFRIDLSIMYDVFGNSLRFEWYVTSAGVVEQKTPASGTIMKYTIEQVCQLLSAGVEQVPQPLRENKIVVTANAIRYWPSPQDYNESIQNPSTSFQTPVLRSGKVAENEIGLPRVATGAFASVYKVGTNSGDCAVKCFLGLTPDLELRYALLSNFILKDDLECTVDFDFISEGIRVRDTWYPVLRMVWVEGLPLSSYVQNILDDQSKLCALCDDFLKTVEELRRAGIAHGDLQHGNILVTDEGIRLVDYDGMFVPGMARMASNEIGHRNYQHPRRRSTHFGPYLDNFSQWVIYVALKALIADPSLWKKLDGGDECLLLRKADFDHPDDSEALRLMGESPSEEVRTLVARFREIIQMTVEQVPPLELTNVILVNENGAQPKAPLSRPPSNA